ncbi:unnamed protein product [Triticum turgidum subsp. durum]|uniref:GDSL esterase/lipase n=1 Tax=Triticum turgidum subsp. durum TaxID=4567 RepID=A0A9R1QKW3_TRITD|nr:unnamed protein product [Triticum turgidum subsp. durum]
MERVSPWLLLLVLLVAASGPGARADPQVPCYFVFGDSLVDNGNNNDIASLARANYPPYGIDFPGGATGRFSNGLTTVDAISRLLGFDDYIPAYAGANNDQLLSGAAVQQLVSILGDEDSAANHLSQCIFTVGMGSNDYLNNYFMPAVYATSRQYTPEQYADVLILYNNGARKVALMGVGQVGCSPNELAQQSSDGVTCVARINGAIEIFNQKLVELVDQFNTLPGAHFTYINAYGIFQDIIRSPGANGLTVLDKGCCGVGRNNGQVTCLPFQTPCANRNEYLFWDAFHPTEAANILVGRRAYSAAQPSDVHPVDLQTLARL